MSEKQPVIPNLLVRATKFIQERQEIIDGRSMFGESEGTDSIKITLYGKLADVLSRALVLSSPNDPFYGLNIGEEDQGFNNYQSVDPDTLPLDSFDDLIKIDMVGLRTRLMEARKKKDIGGLKTIVDEIVEVRNIIENRTTYQNYIARKKNRKK